MPIYCKLREPKWKNYNIEAPFKVGGEGHPAYECLRMLAGTVDFEEKHTSRIIKSRTNFLKPGENIRKNHASEITKILFNGNLRVDEFSVALKKNKRSNYDYWEKIKAELCLCLIAYHDKNYPGSFLHLYRIIEKISIAIPLMFASVETDFSKGLSFLKKLINQPRDGELTAFRSFTDHLEHLHSYQNLTFDYKFPKAPVRWHEQLSEQLKKYVFCEPNLDHNELDSCEGVEVSFSQVVSFYVVVRNRMFHYSHDKANFDLDEMGGADFICKTMIEPTLNWLSLIKMEIIEKETQKVI